MAIPSLGEMLPALIEELEKAGGMGKAQDIIEKLAQRFSVTTAERNLRDPSGPRTFDHRVHSAVARARLKLGLIEPVKKSGRDTWILKTELTPVEEVTTEPLVQPLEARPSDMAKELLQRILSVSSDKFERLVGKLLEVKGLSDIRITGRPGDRGIDGEAKVPFLDIQIAFQAKRYDPTNTISYQDVAAFKGSLSTRGLSRGVFVTTSSFSPGAKEAAEQGEPKIVLVDGDALVAILIEHNIGVVKVPVIEMKIDNGFFGSL